jgi:hypothetical protein
MNLFPMLLAQNEDAGGAIGALMGLCCQCGVFLIFVVPTIAGMWKVFEKAGQPGWAAIIPIYNMYVATQIAGRDILWFILLFVPCVGIVAAILIWMDVAKNFGKDAIWGIGIAFLPFIFLPLLGFGDAKYQPVPKPM